MLSNYRYLLPLAYEQTKAAEGSPTPLTSFARLPAGHGS